MKFSALMLAALPATAAFAPSSQSGRKIDTSLNQWANNFLDVQPMPRNANFVIPDNSDVKEFRGFREQRKSSLKSEFAQKALGTPAPVAEPAAPAAPAVVEEKVVDEVVQVVPYYRTGITEEDVTDADAEAVQLAMDRMSKVCPNFHPDLFGLVFWVQNGDAEEATVALEQIVAILEAEEAGQQNTEALYMSGVHVDIVRTLHFHSDEEEMQQIGMEILQKMSSRVRASNLEFSEVTSLQKSLVSLGASDLAFAAINEYPENVALALYSLSLVNNLIDSYTFDELVEIGLMDKVLSIIEDFSGSSSMLFVACDILFRASKANGADISKLESAQAISLLAKVMEHYGGVDQKIHDKAAQALGGILAIAN